MNDNKPPVLVVCYTAPACWPMPRLHRAVLLQVCKDAQVFSSIFGVNVTTPLIIRPPMYGSNGRTYKMLVMFYFSFFSPTVLRVPSTDRPETLPPDRNLRVFYNASPKIRGGHSPPLQKKN